MYRNNWYRGVSSVPGVMIVLFAIYYAGYSSSLETVNTVAIVVVLSIPVVALVRSLFRGKRKKKKCNSIKRKW